MRRRPELVEKGPERMKRRPELQLSWRRTPGRPGGGVRFRFNPDSGCHTDMAVASTFHSIPNSGRHTDITVASIFTSSQILDAAQTWRWRLLSTPNPILDATQT